MQRMDTLEGQGRVWLDAPIFRVGSVMIDSQWWYLVDCIPSWATGMAPANVRGCRRGEP